jgi:hypothetical protein
MTECQPGRPYLFHEQEGETLWFLGNLVTIKAAGAQTRGRVTVAEFLNPAGSMAAGPGDFVLLPVGLPHTFLVGESEPLRVLQITTPAGFEQFAAAAGEPAGERRLPDPAPPDPAALGRAAAQHAIELLGPPPQR